MKPQWEVSNSNSEKNKNYMYIGNDASILIFFGVLAGRPMTGDRSVLKSRV